jgi:hypothetical protein
MRCKYRRRSTLESEKNVLSLTHPNIVKVLTKTSTLNLRSSLTAPLSF